MDATLSVFQITTELNRVEKKVSNRVEKRLPILFLFFEQCLLFSYFLRVICHLTPCKRKNVWRHMRIGYLLSKQETSYVVFSRFMACLCEVNQAGSAHAFFLIKVFVVFKWGSGLARLLRSRLEQPKVNGSLIDYFALQSMIIHHNHKLS